MEINELFKKLHNGDRRSLAKAITLVESTRQEDTEKQKSSSAWQLSTVVIA